MSLTAPAAILMLRKLRVYHYRRFILYQGRVNAGRGLAGTLAQYKASADWHALQVEALNFVVPGSVFEDLRMAKP